jgi:hypothetical protein
MAEQVRQPELMEAFRERVVMPRRGIAKTILAAGIERGEVRRDLDLEQAADAFVGNVIGRHVGGGEFDDQWFGSLIEFFWRAVRA